MTSEWDPILTPKLTEYAWLRVNDSKLEIKMANHPTYTIVMDAKAIPQMIKILERLDKEI